MTSVFRRMISVAGAIALLGIVRAADKPAASAGIGPSFKGPIGLQLYSLRQQFTNDLPGTLAQVRNWGFRDVELAGSYHLTPAEFKKQLDAHGLVPVSAHFPYERLQNDIEGVAAEAKTLGLEYVGCAWITHQGDFDEKQCRTAIEVFNHAGKALKKHNLKFFYHTHGYEFQPYQDGTLFDLLMRETKPRWVRYEMDIFWIVHPGQDPVRLFQKYGRRFELMHLKDMKKGLKTGELTGHSDVSNDVALGTGQLDWPSILSAAKKAGVKYYFIEDESPSSTSQIPQSLRFLEQIQW